MQNSGSIILLLGHMIACASATAGPQTRLASADRLDEWKQVHAPSGTITLTGRKHGQYYRAYLCPTYAAAVSVVTSTRAAATRVKDPKRLKSDFNRSLRRAHCVPISSPAQSSFYKPFDVGTFAVIDWGFEAQEEWTPIRAFNPDGQVVNLVYDASVYAISD